MGYDQPIVIASNRGPVSFAQTDSELIARRGSGGLSSALGALVANTDAIWIAAAMTAADRSAAANGLAAVEGFNLQLLDIDPATYRASYDVIANSTLWYLHHGMFDQTRRPLLDHKWHEAWDSYRRYNHIFAEALAAAAPEGSVVLVQDYHLSLVPKPLRTLRPDVKIVHFLHTPHFGPNSLHVLPNSVATEYILGLNAADACGFHSARWERAYRACATEVLGEAAHSQKTFVSPLAPDATDLQKVAQSEACFTELTSLEDEFGDQKLIVRIDRIEPSKNLIRGFLAYELLLERRVDLHGRIAFLALAQPSRETLPEYMAYRNEVEGCVARINHRFGNEAWNPIQLRVADSFPSSVAAMRRYDVLCVNPIKDGLNLIAKEGPLVNTHDGMLVLSTEAGAHDELGEFAISINPFDLVATAHALEEALDATPGERSAQLLALNGLIGQRNPGDWLADQLSQVG